MDDGAPRNGWYSAQQDAARGAFEYLDAGGRTVVVTRSDEASPAGLADYRLVGRVGAYVRRIRWPRQPN